MSTTTKQRIEYIDLAKGFCILLVVLSHIMSFYRVTLPYDSVLKCFRMPLYFFLSGVFFKQYENFFGFLKRKTNKLVIPFLFFFFALSVAFPMALYHLCGIKLLSFHESYSVWKTIEQAVTHEMFPNTAIWFLVCLFEVNIIFYGIYLAAKRCGRYSWGAVALLSCLCGAAGMLMSYCQCNLYFFADTALTSMPFFAFGYLLNRKSRALYANWRYDRWLWLAVALGLVLLFWLAYPLDYRKNYFEGCYFTAHLCGAVGTVVTIIIAKKVGHIPVLTWWGRYSIMILCTHQVVYQLLEMVLCDFVPRGWWRVGANVAATMALYFVLIPLMKRFMPHVTAQKDVLRVG